jgi:hypothetical protein
MSIDDQPSASGGIARAAKLIAELDQPTPTLKDFVISERVRTWRALISMSGLPDVFRDACIEHTHALLTALAETPVFDGKERDQPYFREHINRFIERDLHCLIGGLYSYASFDEFISSRFGDSRTVAWARDTVNKAISLGSTYTLADFARDLKERFGSTPDVLEYEFDCLRCKDLTPISVRDFCERVKELADELGWSDFRIIKRVVSDGKLPSQGLATRLASTMKRGKVRTVEGMCTFLMTEARASSMVEQVGSKPPPQGSRSAWSHAEPGYTAGPQYYIDMPPNPWEQAYETEPSMLAVLHGAGGSQVHCIDWSQQHEISGDWSSSRTDGPHMGHVHTDVWGGAKADRRVGRCWAHEQQQCMPCH